MDLGQSSFPKLVIPEKLISPSKLLAFAGLESSTYESGNFTTADMIIDEISIPKVVFSRDCTVNLYEKKYL